MKLSTSKWKTVGIGLTACTLVFLCGASSVRAYAIEKLPDATVYNDFVVGPGKIQLDMKPDDSRTVNVIVTNRLGREKTFSIGIEDFAGTRDPLQTVVLLGSDHGPYSLKDYMEIASTSFDLGHAERATIPVTIRVPSDAQPGGLYGTVIVSTVSAKDNTAADISGVGSSPVITRIGTLFFIRVAGEVKQDGKLTKFSLKNNSVLLGGGDPVDFRLLYENNGTIHENPYGLITVQNMLGSTVATVEVEPWFALPNSLRLREVAWNPPFLFGRYTAHAAVNRGYDNIIDDATVTFWVIPWKIILLVLVALFIIIGGIRWIVSKFKISKR